jgi:hypothetical protein
LIGVKQRLRDPRLRGDDREVAWRRRAAHRFEDVIVEREVLRVAPEKWNRIAILVRHGQFAELLGRERGIAAGFDVTTLFHHREAVHLRNAVDDIHLGDGRDVRVVDVVGVGGELRGADAERLHRRRRAVVVENGLRIAGHVRRHVRVEPIRARIRAEIRVE